MALKYKIGNLLNSEAAIIAHGVNCSGVFNAEVAKQIRNRWPQVYEAYVNKHRGPGWILGDIQLVDIEDKERKITIANLATQRGYGYDVNQRVYVNYPAIGICFLKLLQFCSLHNLTVAIPKIGAGLAGGDWSIISLIIEKHLRQYPIDLTVYTL